MTNSIKPHTRRKGMCRMLLFSALPPLLLFVLFCCTAANTVAAVHRCGHDRIAKHRGPQPEAMVVELPQKGRSGVSLLTAAQSGNNGWAPIRITFFYEDLKDESRYCTKVGESSWSFFEGEILDCLPRDILTEEKKSILVNELLPGAIKLHSDRLFVQPVTGNIVVPKFTEDVCSHFKIPDSHHTEGVENADFVLYVAAGVAPDISVGWAIHCSSDPKTKRPLVGVINFNSRHIVYTDKEVRATAHEIGHALGFNFDVIESKGLVEVLTDRSIRGKPKVYIITGPKTAEKAREHYNCKKITGMELEDEGTSTNRVSHWEMRNAKDELMSPTMGAGYYTGLTMALFEDLGYYRANWSMAETMAWGLNAGCEFLEKKCVTNGVSNFPDMFCTDFDLKTSQRRYTCVSDRNGLGKCSIKTYGKPLPEHFQYFDFHSIGGLSRYADYCPFIDTSYYGVRCGEDGAGWNLGSRFGSKSKCVKGNDLHYEDIPIGDVCADIKCGDGTVSVRYYDNDTWISCPDGQKITPQGGFTKGTIVCPKYHEVCLEVGVNEREHLKKYAARAAVSDTKKLWNRVLEANEDFAQTVGDVESSLDTNLNEIKTIKTNANLIAGHVPSKQFSTKLDELSTMLTDARDAAVMLKNAEAVPPKYPNKMNFTKVAQLTWKWVLEASAGNLIYAARNAARAWANMEKVLLVQMENAETTVEKILKVSLKTTEAAKLFEGSPDDNVKRVKDNLNGIKDNLIILALQVMKISVASLNSYRWAGDGASIYMNLV